MLGYQRAAHRGSMASMQAQRCTYEYNGELCDEWATDGDRCDAHPRNHHQGKGNYDDPDE